MNFHKIMQHTDGRSRDIYGAQGWGETRRNCFRFIIGLRANPLHTRI